MAAQYVARAVGWALGCLVAPILLGAMFGPRWVGVGAAVALVATLWLQLWLPRAAHAAFEAGRYPKAARRYGLLAALAFTGARARAAALSRAGCEIARGRHERGLALLAELDGAALDLSERVVWLNNRACAALDAGADAPAALALADEATTLRPDVPAVQHTRARALLAVGRVDDAIAVLEGMRTGGELAPALEAARCQDLARAWDRKGHDAYADDYRARAALVAR